MKYMAFLAPLLISLTAHAGIHYDCNGNNGNSSLTIDTILAEGPDDLAVTLRYGFNTTAAGTTHFAGESAVDPALGGYALNDGCGHKSALILTSVPILHHPCGRAGCDFDGSVQATAVLKLYDGEEMNFSCQ